MNNRYTAVMRPFEEHRDYMNDRIASGIEANRKGWMTLIVKDGQGQPIPGAHIELRQKTHDFRYGANLFMLDEFAEPERNAGYKDYFKNAFNLATLPFYWHDLEPEEGKPRFSADSPRIYRRPAPDLCLDFCFKNGIEPKAHCLCYDQWNPDWLQDADVATIKKAYIRRISALGERYAKSIPTWEVTNELLFQGGDNRSALFYEPDYALWCYDMANRFFPGNQLMINDAHCNIWNVFNHAHSAYYMQIENLLLKGARIDAIGMQFHMFYWPDQEEKMMADFYNPRRIYDVMDYYARLGRPLQITELTIPAYSYKEEDEAIQAEIIKNLYSMWFSHEAMQGIIYWNIVDGYAAFAPQGDMTCGENFYHGGLVRYDFTPKPAYNVIRDLFSKTWRTITSVNTSDSGRAEFKGFYGEYEAKITANGRTLTTSVHLSKTAKPIVHLTVPD